MQHSGVTFRVTKDRNFTPLTINAINKIRDLWMDVFDNWEDVQDVVFKERLL